MQITPAIFPWIAGPPTTASVSAVAAAAAAEASFRLRQSAEPTNIPATVTAASEDPCPANTS